MADDDHRACVWCSTPLSRFNTTTRCSSCQRRVTAHAAPEFWADEEVRAAARRWDVGTIVRLYRRHTGLSQSTVARFVNIDQSEVSRLERGSKTLRRRDQVITWTAGLGAPDGIIGTLPAIPEPAETSSAASTSSDGLWIPPSASATGLQAFPRQSESTMQQFTMHIERLFVELCASDNLFGPRHTVPLALAQMHQVETLLSSAQGEPRTQLLSLAARHAEFLGWLYQDLFDLEAARTWSDRAIGWAQQTDDPIMSAYVLMRKSNIASDQGNSELAVSLAKDAERAAVAQAPGLRALILRQDAAAAALNGDEAQCMSFLDRADEQIQDATADTDESAALTAYCSPAYVESERANWWVTLGKPGRAVEYFETILGSWDDRFLRDRGLYLARLALAYASSGEPESACQVGMEAVDIAQATGSGRIEKKLAELCVSLDRWPTLTVANDLRAVIHSGSHDKVGS